MKSLNDIFGPNAPLVEDLFERYKKDPKKVPSHWRNYFESLTNGKKHSNRDTEEQKKQPHSSLSSTFQVKKKQSFIQDIPPSGILQQGNYHSIYTKQIPITVLSENIHAINSFFKNTRQRAISYSLFFGWTIINIIKKYPHLYSLFQRNNSSIEPNISILFTPQDSNFTDSPLIATIPIRPYKYFKEFLIEYYSAKQNAVPIKNIVEETLIHTSFILNNTGNNGLSIATTTAFPKHIAMFTIGTIDYPPSYHSASQDVLSFMRIGKTVSLTLTIPQHITTQIEANHFLNDINDTLNGKTNFYQHIFSSLNVPFNPMHDYQDDYSQEHPFGENWLEYAHKTVSVMQIIYLYRSRGHVLANTNPLYKPPYNYPEFDFKKFDLTIWDMERTFYCGGFSGQKKASLRKILTKLRNIYANKFGIEYMHVLGIDERRWLRQAIESNNMLKDIEREEMLLVYKMINKATTFEQFLHKKYVGHKRFSLEGCEILIPTMHFLLEEAGKQNISQLYIGMAHRGRLNILANIMNHKLKAIFYDFEGHIDSDSPLSSSNDVRYHISAKGTHTCTNGKNIHIHLLPNPSHLESVCPVVEGAVRAVQDSMKTKETHNEVIPVLIHGDAAFSGQGVVAETLNMSQLSGYKTCGTIHIIINNQIGFTTLPKDARSTEYASDLAKMILAPIIHINGDDPDSAIKAIRLALLYRQTFHKDIVIDLICYRRYGHNEGDDPAFTQPDMYKEIKKHPSIKTIYRSNLIDQGFCSEEEINTIEQQYQSYLEHDYHLINRNPNQKERTISNRLERNNKIKHWEDNHYTGSKLETLKEIGIKLNTLPPNFDANPKLLRLLAIRAKIIQENLEKIDWGFAEQLAFGSILKEGYSVRLVGQDAERGTFSQRHAILHGTSTPQCYTPLKQFGDKSKNINFYIYNSLLSEFAALGFEYGYSLFRHKALIIWEAQFGDFANGAQVIIDQYISCSESKWNQCSSLVLNLPHGYEGQGPEHSSARIERYLQLCAEHNMVVTNPTTPKQYFHLLRKQAQTTIKKPLIIMTPKSLLRHPKVVNNIQDLAHGEFESIIPSLPKSEQKYHKRVTTLLLCSGKLYYELEHFQQTNIKYQHTFSIVRVEQLYPFPEKQIQTLINQLPNIKTLRWCQEEPKNMGSWNFIAPKLQQLKSNCHHLSVCYVGRKSSATTATGSVTLHHYEQQQIIQNAFRETEME